MKAKLQFIVCLLLIQSNVQTSSAGNFITIPVDQRQTSDGENIIGNIRIFDQYQDEFLNNNGVIFPYNCNDAIVTDTADYYEKELNPGDAWHNPPLLPHQLICLEEGTIIEVSTPDSVEDNYRVGKGDSQK